MPVKSQFPIGTVLRYRYRNRRFIVMAHSGRSDVYTVLVTDLETKLSFNTWCDYFYGYHLAEIVDVIAL